MWVFNYVHKNDEASSTRNIATWEAMLDIVYNNKSLSYVVRNHKWLDTNGDTIDITHNLSWNGYFNYLINEDLCNK